MYFHSQNLKKEDHEKGLIHWRCWIGQQPEVTFFIKSPSSFWHINLDLCENGWQEEAIGLNIACPLFSIAIGFRHRGLYIFLEKITKRKDQKYTNGRVIGVSYHSGTFWFNLWEDPMESRGKDPKWWRFSINLNDLLFGKATCVTKILKTGEAKIDMPEGLYPCSYKVENRIWTRPRFNFSRKSRLDIWFDIPIGIPHEGKGENSWDIGMDATFGIGEELNDTLPNILKKIANRCLKERQWYGSLSSPDYAKWRKEGIAKQNEKHTMPASN